MRSAVGWFIEHFFRWLPYPSPSGLFTIGHPGRNSPVIASANFSLTVRRVKKAIKGQNVWLLVINTNGINVWCAADGGILTEKRVIEAIKTSGLADKIEHREIILPALSASGVDTVTLKEETGFDARFGPVYAKDIPAYLASRQKKTEAMRRFNFGLNHRLDMFVSMNFPVYLVFAVILAVFFRQYLLGYSILFWSAVAFLYILVDVIPGKTGWGQVLLSAAVITIGWGAIDGYLSGDPFVHWGWFVATFAIFFSAGFDLAGTVTPRKSDAEMMIHRLGFKSLGALFSERSLGEIHLDQDRCTGCGTCFDICPLAVFEEPDADHKTDIGKVNTCFSCNACVKQCPEGALLLL
jgi:NAD-dependent dihydropyrimidine dehydrogenase PreA subunit